MTRKEMDEVLDWISNDLAAKRAAGRRLTEDDCAMYDALVGDYTLLRRIAKREAYPEQVGREAVSV